MIPMSIRKKLPKAKLFVFSYSPPISAKFKPKSLYYRTRGANFIRHRIWNFIIEHRAPYLEYVARSLHPELFNSFRGSKGLY